jgi:hypothetical protein
VFHLIAYRVPPIEENHIAENPLQMRTAKVRILNHARELTGLKVRTEKEDMV